MSLDAFSVVVAFFAAVEGVLGALVLVLGLREARATPGPAAEARRPLLALSGAALVGVAVVSVPLLWLLLASWVPRWPGVMCVEGVRRIGTGTIGPSSWLPGLVNALDLTKLATVFAAGAWVALRRASGGAPVRAAALAAAALGLVALVDGAVEAAFVVLPRDGIRATAGCCTTPEAAAALDEGLTAAGATETGGEALSTGLVAGLSAVLGGLALRFRRRMGEGRARALPLGLIAIAGLALLPPAARHLAEFVAPRVLGLPFHRCVWCAFAQAPETIVAAALLVGAAFSTGWALLAGVFGSAGSRAGEAAVVRTLLGAAAFGYLGAAVMAISFSAL
jgi:hypothetical protein